MWKTTTYKKIKINKPVLLEGLPGIANVGKIVVDYLIEQLDAQKITSFFSYELPNSVFVNENNLVELPKLEIYHKKVGRKDFLFLSGDIQPQTEAGSYSFSEMILDFVEKRGCKEIITLGGIGLQEIPDKPKVFCTGNDSKYIEIFTKAGANKHIYGLVGPIIGVSGLLVGLSSKRKIKAAALLAETYGHPMYLGLKGAKETLKILEKYFKFGVNFKDLNKEIRLMEKELKGEEVNSKDSPLKRLKKVKETTYIG